MDNNAATQEDKSDFEVIKSELIFTELEDRLEMVQVASGDQERCTIHGDDACKYP